MQILIRILLVTMVLFGLWGAGRIAYDQYQTGEACPILGSTIPACYVAFFGYVLIAIGIGMALATTNSSGSYPFWTGTAIAGGLAALASVLELIKGDVCPVAFGHVPMCYLSLALSVPIAILFTLVRGQG
jgi:hypothetical protein